MNVLLATGLQKLEETLRSRFTDVDFQDRNVLFREGVDERLRLTQSDIVIISERLDGNTLSHNDLIKLIRKRHPGKRIIYILNEDNVKMRKFLYQLGIYDVFALKPRLNLVELGESIHHPKTWEDVHHYFGDMDDASSLLDLNFNDEDEQIDETNYSSFDTQSKPMLDSLSMQIASFWSVRDQSGKTFLSINTSLMLAQNPQQKVLLLDFNLDNANMHLQFGFSLSDGNKNLGALLEDQAEGIPLTTDTLDDYLLVHSTYRNLHMLPGFVLKLQKPTDEAIIQAFDRIIAIAMERNYTAVLIDLNSDLYEPYLLHIIQRSHKVFTAITESPTSIFAIGRCFDREVGPFFTNFINQNKIVPVLNQSAMDTKSMKVKAFVQSILETPVSIIFPYDERIRNSIFHGEPLLKRKPDEDMYYNFVLMANHIQNLFIVPPNPFGEPNEEKKVPKSRFNLFGKGKK